MASKLLANKKLMFFISAVFLLGCTQNQQQTNQVNLNFQELQDDNLSHFKALSPEHFDEIPQYRIITELYELMENCESILKSPNSELDVRKVLMAFENKNSRYLNRSVVDLLPKNSQIDVEMLLLLKYVYGQELRNHFYERRFTFSHLEPVIVPQKEIIKVGDEFVAAARLAVFDKYNPFEVIWEGEEVEDSIPGRPIIREPVLTTGLKKREGEIKYHYYQGDMKMRFSIEYEVVEEN